MSTTSESLILSAEGHITNKIRFSNLNLNHNKKCRGFIPVKTSKLKFNKGGFNMDDIQEKRGSPSLKEVGINSVSKTNSDLKYYDKREKELKNRGMNDRMLIASSSTLTLHIAAYENSTEALNDNEKNTKKKATTKELLSFESNLQDPFSYPRQILDDQKSFVPEIMRFKASQKLILPRQISPLPKSRAPRVTVARKNKSKMICNSTFWIVLILLGCSIFCFSTNGYINEPQLYSSTESNQPTTTASSHIAFFPTTVMEWFEIAGYFIIHIVIGCVCYYPEKSPFFQQVMSQTVASSEICIPLIVVLIKYVLTLHQLNKWESSTGLGYAFTFLCLIWVAIQPFLRYKAFSREPKRNRRVVACSILCVVITAARVLFTFFYPESVSRVLSTSIIYCLYSWLSKTENNPEKDPLLPTSFQAIQNNEQEPPPAGAPVQSPWGCRKTK